MSDTGTITEQDTTLAKRRVVSWRKRVSSAVSGLEGPRGEGPPAVHGGGARQGGDKRKLDAIIQDMGASLPRGFPRL